MTSVHVIYDVKNIFIAIKSHLHLTYTHVIQRDDVLTVKEYIIDKKIWLNVIKIC